MDIDNTFPDRDLEWLRGETRLRQVNERWVDFALHAPPMPANWQVPVEDIADIDGYVDTPDAIAQHHAAWAVAFADAVLRLADDRYHSARSRVRRWSQEHSNDPKYRKVLYRVDGVPVESAAIVAHRLQKQLLGHDLWADDLDRGIRAIDEVWREEAT